VTVKRAEASLHTGSSRLAALALVLLVCASAFASASAEDSKTGTLEVAVAGLESEKGVLIVALLSTPEMFETGEETFREAKVAIRDGRATARFSDVPYGRYAIKTFHDENSNDKLDTNFVGFPKESFGFSNDAMGKFGPPTFEQASFLIEAPEVKIQINSN
jgi:uncharacterized protein (DUF2141 family)